MFGARWEPYAPADLVVDAAVIRLGHGYLDRPGRGHNGARQVTTSLLAGLDVPPAHQADTKIDQGQSTRAQRSCGFAPGRNPCASAIYAASQNPRATAEGS